MPSSVASEASANLRGTTFKVYRFIMKQRQPVGVLDVQKVIGLSSPSVAKYHIKKLLQMGLVREEQGGYVVDRVVLDIIRIRRASIPVQTRSHSSV